MRSGPYVSLIARFSITIPDTYPDLPPLITFTTEIFHPLVVPLTTYTYSTGVDASGTVSANDDERLPPGSFSLRDGFPDWFGEGRRRSRLSRDFAARSISPMGDVLGSSPMLTPQPQRIDIGISKILAYLSSTFTDASVLDNIPLDCAGNPGAWHAWRAYRRLPRYVSPSRPISPIGSPNRVLKHPGDWNWDGVWESRVRSQVELSKSESVLFGSARKGEMIRFANLSDEKLREFRDEMLGTAISE